jgi:FG-GAP repeat
MLGMAFFVTVRIERQDEGGETMHDPAAYQTPRARGNAPPVVPMTVGQLTHRVRIRRSLLLLIVVGAIGALPFASRSGDGSPGRSNPPVRSDRPSDTSATSASAVRAAAARPRHRRAAAASGQGPDFDGDGFADLAIGAPYANLGRRDAGTVHVIHGSPSGLDRDRRQRWTQASPGVQDQPEVGDLFGWTLANGDFDGDGFSDLAITALWEDAGQKHGGAVHVLRGSPTGLTSDGARFWHQGSPGILGAPKRNNDFGWAAVAADFDGNGFDDLALSAPREDIGARDSGRVHVLYGSPDGLRAMGSQAWSQDSPGIADHGEANDRFGVSLAAGDFDGDGDAELAIGVAYESRRPTRMGIVHVLRGTPRGLVARGSRVWSQDTPGIADNSSLRDQFGQSLASGDLNRDGLDDLIVGVWYEDFRNDLTNEGAFHVILGSRRGLRARGSQFWHEDSPGVLSRGALSERISWSLATLDLNGDGRDDLAVGTPHSDVGGDPHANKGAVHLFFGARGGLTARGDRYLTQDSPGVDGRAERFDRFGETLGGADFDGDGFDDLVVGNPWENVRRPNDGAVYVAHGSRRGISLARDRTWTARVLAPASDGRGGQKFGWSTSTVNPGDGSPSTGDPEN